MSIRGKNETPGKQRNSEQPENKNLAEKKAFTHLPFFLLALDSQQ